jgi:hypothetical protein
MSRRYEAAGTSIMSGSDDWFLISVGRADELTRGRAGDAWIIRIELF